MQKKEDSPRFILMYFHGISFVMEDCELLPFSFCELQSLYCGTLRIKELLELMRLRNVSFIYLINRYNHIIFHYF